MVTHSAKRFDEVIGDDDKCKRDDAINQQALTR
jgi:hypothetical protein